MSKPLRITLIVLAAVVAGVMLLSAGFLIGRSRLGRFILNPIVVFRRESGLGPGMMGRFWWRNRQDVPDKRLPGRPVPSLPDRRGGGMMPFGAMPYGRMVPDATEAEPLTIEQAQQAIQESLDSVGNADLELHEVMIFDNHAYGEIVEKSTGIGAMEVLVDPLSLAVYPEPGPNMMWNLKYGMMGRFGGMGMMHRWRDLGNTPPDVSSEMTVSPEEAVDFAQQYLDEALPGTQVEDHADPFYGYYTLHVLKDGEVVGMLSVNGFTGRVFPHTWHGEFIEMSEE